LPCSDQKFDQVLYGRQKTPPRWTKCVGEATRWMGNAVGSLYIRKYGSQAHKSVMLEMIQHLKDAFKAQVEKNTWMDTSTRNAALEKVLVLLDIGH